MLTKVCSKYEASTGLASRCKRCAAWRFEHEGERRYPLSPRGLSPRGTPYQEDQPNGEMVVQFTDGTEERIPTHTLMTYQDYEGGGRGGGGTRQHDFRPDRNGQVLTLYTRGRGGRTIATKRWPMVNVRAYWQEKDGEPC